MYIARGSSTHSDGEDQAVARLLRVLGHPVRLRVLAAFGTGELSPVEFTGSGREARATLGTVAYHFRQLAAAHLIEPAATVPHRGAVEHRYRLTRRGRAAIRLLDCVAGDGPAGLSVRPDPGGPG